MGYRSYGNLVFPAKYLSHFAKTVYPNKEHFVTVSPVLEEWDDKTAWRNNEGIDMIRLAFSGWKWYESYSDIQKIETFMNNLEDWYELQFRAGVNKIFQYGEEIPEEVIVKDYSTIKAINNFTVGLKQVEWNWGYNRQGEETEDYTQYGATDTLWHEHNIEWGCFEYYLDDIGWVFAVIVTPEEKAILEAAADKFPIPPMPLYTKQAFRDKPYRDDNEEMCVLYSRQGMMPKVEILNEYFVKLLGKKVVDKKEADDQITWAQITENGGFYHIEGYNYWEWEVQNESYPDFETKVRSGDQILDFDEVLQRYMKVAKEE